jgi:hypothetical protein
MFSRGLKFMLLVALVAVQGCPRPQKPRGYMTGKAGPTIVLGSAPKIAQNLGVTFAKQITLVGFNISPSPVVKGQRATLEIVWKCLAKPTYDWVVWTRIDHRDSAVSRLIADHRPAVPTTSWRPGKYYADRLVFQIPEHFKGGLYDVFLGLYGSAGPQRRQIKYATESLLAGGERRGVISVALSRGEKGTAMSAESREPSVSEKLGVTFGGELLLVGYTLKPSTVEKGKAANLEIVWKCLAKPKRSWIIWTRIDYLGTAAKSINRDHPPLLPTTLWEPGKFYRDNVNFMIPASEKPGKYRLSIGLYAGIVAGKPPRYLPEKVMQGGKRYGTLEVGFSGKQ